MVSRYNFPISTLPAPYEIVWCRFPHEESLGTPGPVPRPGLVRSTAAMDDGTGEVEVVFGTTNLKLSSRPFDLIVSKASEMNACGLYRATRFDLEKSVWLPWNTDWFEIRPDFFSPVIGQLTPDTIKLLQITMAYKQRFDAMAAEAAAKPAKAAAKAKRPAASSRSKPSTGKKS